MVEFGLKLEDNKVSEWSDKYIDYEALKKILKKASAAVKKKDELVKRKPELAEEIVLAYQQGTGPNQFPTPHSSQDGLTLLETSLNNIGLPIQEGEDEDNTQLVDQVPTSASESQPLLKTAADKYESHGTMSSERSTSALSAGLSRIASGYFSNSKYEQRIRESLDEIENLEARFNECINHEVRRMR
jgi:hypothetical protein